MKLPQPLTAVVPRPCCAALDPWRCQLQAFRRLAGDMVEGRDSETGPQPPNLVPRQWSLLPPVVIDSTPFGEQSSHHVSCPGLSGGYADDMWR